MREVLVELAEPVAVVVYAVLASALTVLGLSLEWLGLSGLGGGVGVPPLWLAYMGAIAIAAGWAVARRKVLPAVRRTTAA